MLYVNLYINHTYKYTYTHTDDAHCTYLVHDDHSEDLVVVAAPDVVLHQHADEGVHLGSQEKTRDVFPQEALVFMRTHGASEVCPSELVSSICAVLFFVLFLRREGRGARLGIIREALCEQVPQIHIAPDAVPLAVVSLRIHARDHSLLWRDKGKKNRTYTK